MSFFNDVQQIWASPAPPPKPAPPPAPTPSSSSAFNPGLQSAIDARTQPTNHLIGGGGSGMGLSVGLATDNPIQQNLTPSISTLGVGINLVAQSELFRRNLGR